jgi:hypothetical protein
MTYNDTCCRIKDQRIVDLEAALLPFALIADEIEKTAKECCSDGINVGPEDIGAAAPYELCVAARRVIGTGVIDAENEII